MRNLIMIGRIVAFAAVASAVSVQAQVPDPFTRMFPLNVGDRWDFVVESHEFSQPGPIVVEDLGRERWTVEEVEQSGDVTRAILRQRRWAADGNPTTGALCSFSRQYSEPVGTPTHLIWVEKSSLENTCSMPGMDSTQFRITSAFGEPPPYLIGGVSYPLEAIHYGFDSLPIDNGVLRDSFWKVGSDVGLMFIRWSEADSVNYSDITFELAYARVNGLEYGVVPVVGEEEAVPIDFALELAYPNPFRDQLTLRVRQPNYGVVKVEVFDLLGRLVAEHTEAAQPGMTEIEFDGRLLARGSYVVRVSSSEGGEFTRRVVRID